MRKNSKDANNPNYTGEPLAGDRNGARDSAFINADESTIVRMPRPRLRDNASNNSGSNNSEPRFINADNVEIFPPQKKKRKRGCDRRGPNKMTRVVKEAILLAGERSGHGTWIEPRYNSKGKITIPGYWKWTGNDGLVGYLEWLAQNEPSTYGGLLGKVLPLQINTRQVDEDEAYETPEEVAAALKRKGVSMALVDKITQTVFLKKIETANKRRQDDDEPGDE